MQKLRWKIAQFFENFWWKNYLKGKSPEKYLIWKKNYWQNFFNEIEVDLDTLKGNSIDIGCGPAGVFTMLLSTKVCAVDPLLSEYEKLAIFKKEFYPSISFIESSFEDFSSTNKYANVFCLNAINHFIDIDLSFKKLYDLCEENGQLIVSIDAHNHPFFKKLFSLIPFDILHPHQYDLNEYQAFLNKNGFEITKRKLMKKEFFFSYWVLVASKKSV